MKGNLLKLVSKLSRSKVEYELPIGDQLLPMNQFIGKNIKFSHTGNIYCIETGKKIKKSYNSGYSYEAFLAKAACDSCIVQPEKCHYHLGTCREPLWGEAHCMNPHILYLSVTSGLKVGITRKTQVPTRWIDQGAEQALAVLELPNRYAAGLAEVLLKNDFADKTQWRKMLSETADAIDLKDIAAKTVKKYKEKLEGYQAKILDEKQTKIKFPVTEYPEKIKSIGFDKVPEIEGVLHGIKGQYLYIGDFVLNMRKHQGYEIEFSS